MRGLCCVKSIVVACALFLCISCAFVDQKVDLSYERIVNSGGGSGELLIAKPKEEHGLSRKANGWIIGTVKNGYGMHTADVITENDLGDWVVGALVEELNASGYQTKTVTALPIDVSKGLDLTVLRVFVDQDTGFWTIGAISDLRFRIEIWKNGVKAKTLNIVATADERAAGGSATTKGVSLRKAMQSAMQQAVPDIIKTLEERE